VAEVSQQLQRRLTFRYRQRPRELLALVAWKPPERPVYACSPITQETLSRLVGALGCASRNAVAEFGERLRNLSHVSLPQPGQLAFVSASRLSVTERVGKPGWRESLSKCRNALTRNRDSSLRVGVPPSTPLRPHSKGRHNRRNGALWSPKWHPRNRQVAGKTARGRHKPRSFGRHHQLFALSPPSPRWDSWGRRGRPSDHAAQPKGHRGPLGRR
jgi:hypothetical protein